MTETTFLNNKKLDGELYGLLQSISDYSVIDKKMNLFQTYVSKDKMPTQAELCKMLKIKSPKTLREHLQALDNAGYIKKNTDKSLNIAYFLPEIEDIYFLIPLETNKYLSDNCRAHVFKIYIYLGQRYKMALKEGKVYEFTLNELGEHIGISVKNHAKMYEMINHALELLYNSGLIEYVSFFDGVMKKKKLTNFSFEYSKPNG